MKHHRTVLPNGLRVLTVPMPSFESVTVLVLVGAGSRYETKNNNGISHFLEHMAFKGTKKRPSAMRIATIIDGIGGEFNAFTGKEATGYYVKSSNNHLELCLDVLSDMLRNSLFDEKEINKERGVILEEINLYEDTPARKIGDVFERLLYGDTPMGWDIAGEKHVISSVARADFLEYLKSLYSAANMTVVIAGGLPSGRKEKSVAVLVEKYFSPLPTFDTIKYRSVIETQDKPQVLIKAKKTEQVHIALGVRTVSVKSPRRYSLSVLSAILGGGMSSRLFNEVREKRGLAYYVRTTSDQYQDSGSLVSTAGIDPKRVDEAIKVIREEYEKVSRVSNVARISREELKKAKEYLKGHFVLELEDSRAVANFFASQELLEDEIESPEEIMEKIEKVTLADVIDAAKDYLAPERLNLAVIGNFEDRQRFEKLLQ